LKRYLDDELARIAFALNGSVMVAYGGMASEDVEILALTTTPVPLLVFDKFEPQRRIGVEPDITDATLTVLDGGIYQALFVATVSQIPSTVQVFIEFTVNGVQARTILVDPSNQTAFSSVAFSVLTRLARGDVISVVVYINSGTASVDFEDVSYFVTRVSGRDA
jgi:hypothetical protein